MKSVQQLRVLAKNPFYQLTNEEVDILQEADSKQATAYRKNIKKKKHVKGAASVKIVGKINKHSTDPTTE